MEMITEPPNTAIAGLVEARPVLESTRELALARPVDLEDLREVETAKQRRRQYWQLLGVVVVLLAILSTVLAVVFGRGKDTGDAPFVPPLPTSPSPTFTSPSPTFMPTILLLDLPNSTMVALDDYSSPQFKAHTWLSEQSNITNLLGWRKEQLFALATFYHTFNGEEWPTKIQDDWLDLNGGRTECNWFSSEYGFYFNISHATASQMVDTGTSTCNTSATFRYLGLELLLDSSFSATMAPEISLLPNLATIIVRRSNITSVLADLIPTQLQQLSHLDLLSFKDNAIHGKIPSELGLLQKLAFLHLDINDLTGSIPSELGSIQTLKDLQLGSNALTGPIPMEFGQCQMLASFSLEANAMTGPIPTELGSIPTLARLNLQENSFTGLIPAELGSQKAIFFLQLDQNLLVRSIPSELGSLTKLVLLVI